MYTGKRQGRRKPITGKHVLHAEAGMDMSTGLDRVAEKARKDSRVRFTALAHHITPEFLKETWKLMNHEGAPGIDGESAQEFERDLERRADEIVAELKAGKYKAPPVRRVEIPKGDGRTRPLGIPTIQDRLLQRAVARILEAIYETEFLDVSYGFRPGRSPHQALRALRKQIVGKKVNYVYEADIRGYFDHINHKWLMKMLALRIGDPVILRLIGKWLKAGVMVDGVVVRTEEGTPQGGPISPILANIYLHYVLDLWFERVFRRQCRGEAYLTRFADDYVVCFQYERDAERLGKELPGRLSKFNLELAEGKTRLIAFGRYAEGRCGRRPQTFEFLGFKHVCGKDRQGRFALIRIPSVKSCRKFLDRVRTWLMSHLHLKRREQQAHLAAMLRGFYQYFSLMHSQPKLKWVWHEVKLQWIRALRRQGRPGKVNWKHLRVCDWYELPRVSKALHPTV